MFLDGETCCGNWKCFTHACDSEGNQLYNFTDFFNKPITEDLFKNTKVEKKIVALSKKKDSVVCSEEELKKFLKIPSLYYVKRGFSKEILKRYNVGFCDNPNSAMYMRSAIPVLDKQGKNIVGIVGRSVFSQCPKCQSYHGVKRDCPEEEWKRAIYSKWKNGVGFNSSQHLYNFWNAKNYFKDTAIIVEGQSDVWRLEEAGIKTSVGMFGCVLKPLQIEMLKEQGITKVIAPFDMDEAGQKGLENLKEKNVFEVIEIKLPTKDVGELSIKQVKEIFRKN
jgi:DNA primase